MKCCFNWIGLLLGIIVATVVSLIFGFGISASISSLFYFFLIIAIALILGNLLISYLVGKDKMCCHGIGCALKALAVSAAVTFVLALIGLIVDIFAVAWVAYVLIILVSIAGTVMLADSVVVVYKLLRCCR